MPQGRECVNARSENVSEEGASQSGARFETSRRNTIRAKEVTVPQTSTETARIRRGRTYAVLGILLLIGVIVSSMIGQVSISPTEVVGTLLKGVGINTSWAPQSAQTELTLWAIRFPRISMGVVVGAALAVAGALMQAIFANPLAEPGVVGVSSGAAVGASISIVFGLTAWGAWVTPTIAFSGALAATLFVYYFSRTGGRSEVTTLLLTGIAVNAFAGSAVAFFTFLASSSSREQIIFWQFGSLNGSRWPSVGLVAIGLAIGLTGAIAIARQLDILSLGDRSARHLGVAVERLRYTGVLLTVTLVGVSVAFVGIIAFVGLVVPHMMRMILGPSHRSLILASALGGAILIVFADLAARTVIPFADLPIGVLTSLVGGPYFFFLLRKTRSRAGGWG